MAHKNNWPTAMPVQEPGELQEMLSHNIDLYRLEPVDTRSAAEIKERIDYYFQWCEDNAVRPQVSAMALALGHTRQWLWKIRELDDERGKIVNHAIAFLETLHNDWALSGKLNPATHCFLAKNWYGYSDVQTLELEPKTSVNGSDLSPEEIAKQIEADIPIDDYEEVQDNGD